MAVEEFLVQIDAGRFVADSDTHNGIAVTEIPSRALHGTYAAADKMCQKLRRRGFRAACVCNVVGTPVSYSELQIALNA
jgi:hypothetical protein